MVIVDDNLSYRDVCSILVRFLREFYAARLSTEKTERKREREREREREQHGVTDDTGAQCT